MAEKRLPITEKNYYKYQIEEYKQVKAKHGITYAKKWFYAKYD